MTREEILQIAKPILFNTEMVRAILEDRKSVTRRVMKLQPVLQDNFWLLNGAVWNDRVHSIPIMPGHSLYNKAKYKSDDYLYVRETWSTRQSNACMGNTTTGCPYDSCESASGPCFEDEYIYKATDSLDPHGSRIRKWRPSIHMPKEAARIFLRVTDVRVERLQDITEDQAIHEGLCRLYDHLSDDEYSAWASRTHINAQKSKWGWKNYLWHGNFGKHGTGNAISNAWEYQYSSYDDPVDSFSSLWNSTLPLNQWNKYGWKANPWVWDIEFERVEV